MTRRTCSVLSRVVFLLLLAVTAWAQAKRPMTLVDMLEVPYLGDPQLSPDGRQILFRLEKADWKADARIGHIWRINADGSGLAQMTNGAKGESSPRWSPDGTRIAFVARREGDGEESQIYLLSNSGGEATALSSHASSVSSVQWAPSGDAIYFLAPDPKTADEKERDKAKDDVFAYDENYKQQHLWKIGVADRAERKVTDGDFSVLSYALSRDGQQVAFVRAPSPLMADSERREIAVMSASGGAIVQLTHNQVEESDPQFSPDGSQMLFRSGSNERFEPYYNSSLFIVPAAGGEARLLLPDFPYGVDHAAWARDGRAIYMVVNMGVHSEIFQVDLATKTPRQLTDGKQSVRTWNFAVLADRHIFTLTDPVNEGEVWVMATAPAAKPVRVTHVFDYLDRDFKLPRQEKVEWKGADGVTVEGVLTYPLDYIEGTRSPLVVHTHGGPQASDKFGFSSWSSYLPVLAAKGYFVLQPNYRGSTGYGNAFLRDMVGHYFKNAHLDVMTGVDELIKRGLVDGNHLIKMGWSGGGHMTNKIITFTDRFKAASSGAGAANWISMYAQSDVRAYRTPWFGGTPWQANAPIDAYWNNSPLNDVAKVKTPTIFLVGKEDVRVPMPQSVEMYRALKSNGIPTHLYVAPREPHGWQELRHELFKMNVELDWFEKYAMGRPYVWEKAPGADKETDAAKERTKASSRQD